MKSFVLPSSRGQLFSNLMLHHIAQSTAHSVIMFLYFTSCLHIEMFPFIHPQGLCLCLCPTTFYLKSHIKIGYSWAITQHHRNQMNRNVFDDDELILEEEGMDRSIVVWKRNNWGKIDIILICCKSFSPWLLLDK